MSRTGPRQDPRPRPEGNDGTQDTSPDTADSRLEHVSGTDCQEKQGVPGSPEQACSRVAGDVSSEVDPLVCSFAKFRSRDFQKDFFKVRTYGCTVASPLPCFSWADSKAVWENMLKKETLYQRDPDLFKHHPQIHPRMRAILLDWLSEVCEIHTLHKETFTLSVDFVDRYLSVTKEVPKEQLQLLGVSALFLASKLEEIYPPKLAEFAYMTDSACTVQDIIRQEMIIVKALKWDLAPMTTNAWLGVFLQVANVDHLPDRNVGFVIPQFSAHAFIQLSRLCDLSLMDYGALHFRYSTIAAAALYHHTSDHLVTDVSGFPWQEIYTCVKWMAPFARAILEVGQTSVKFFSNVKSEDSHNIQTHNVGLPLLERALSHQVVFREKERLVPASVDLSAQLVALLLPPDDDEDDDDDDESTTNVSMGEEEEEEDCSSI